MCRMVTIFLPAYSPESRQCFKYPEHAYEKIFRACIALQKQKFKKNMVKSSNFETFPHPILEPVFWGSYYFSYDIFTSTCRMVTIFLPVYSFESGHCFKYSYSEHAYRIISLACIVLWKQNLKENMVKIRNFKTSRSFWFWPYLDSFP